MKLELNVEDLKIDAKAINEHVSRAILASALGEALEEIIKRELSYLTASWSESRLRTAIEAEIQRIVMQEIRNEYSDQIRAAVREKLSESVLDKLIDAAWAAFLEKAQ